jgi:hypothetical protein
MRAEESAMDNMWVRGTQNRPARIPVELFGMAGEGVPSRPSILWLHRTFSTIEKNYSPEWASFENRKAIKIPLVCHGFD